MMKPDKIVYTASATATGGADGYVSTDDKRVDMKLALPKVMGGASGDGTNAGQLFAACYSACFVGAMRGVADAEEIFVPEDVSVSASVGIGAWP